MGTHRRTATPRHSVPRLSVPPARARAEHPRELHGHVRAAGGQQAVPRTAEGADAADKIDYLHRFHGYKCIESWFESSDTALPMRRPASRLSVLAEAGEGGLQPRQGADFVVTMKCANSSSCSFVIRSAIRPPTVVSSRGYPRPS